MRALRVIGATIVWAAIAVAALLGSIAYHLQLPMARTAARDVLNEFVSGEMRGELRVGRIDELTPGHAVARHVQLFDPYGNRVAVADHVRLTFDLEAARRGVLRFSSAKLTDGTIRLIQSPREDSALPTFIESFEPSDPTPGVGPPLHAIVDGMVVEETTVYGSLLGLDGLRVEDVRLTGRLESLEDVEIRVYSGDGNVVRPFPFVGDVEHLSGVIHTDPRVGLKLHASGAIEREDAPDDQVAVNVTYAVPEGGSPEDEPHLGILVHGEPVHARFLEEVGYAWAEGFEDDVPLDGYFRLGGPVSEQLEMRVWMTTGRGDRIQVSGTIDEETVEITGRTPGVDIAEIMEEWPDIRVAGEGRMQLVAGDEEAPARIRIEAEPFLWEGFAVPSFVLEGDVHEDHMIIDSIEAPYSGGQVSGEGRYDFDGGMHVHVEGNIPQIARDPNLRRFMPDARGGLSGRVSIETADETSDWFRLDGRLVFRDFVYPPFRAQRLVLDGWLAGRPDSPRVQLQADGTGVTVGGYPLGTAEVDIDGGPRVYQATGRFKREGARQLSFDARVENTGRSWVVDSEQIELAIDEDRVWRGAIEQLVYEPDRSVSAERIRLARGSQRLEAGGTYRFRGPEDMHVQLQDFDLAALHVLFGDEMPEVTGRVDTNIQITGDIERPNVVADGFLREGNVYGVEDVTALYAVSYQNGSLTVDGQLDLGARGSLTLSGSGLIDPTIADPFEALEGGVYDLELAVNELSMDVPRRLIGEENMPPVDGRIGGTVDLEGPVFAPTLQGSLTIPALEFPGFPPLEVATAFNYESGVLVGRIVTADDEGELAESEGSLLVDLMNLLQNPDETIASLQTLPWRVSLRVPPRLVEQLPGPVRGLFPEELHPVRASLSGTFAGGGLPTRGDLMVNWEWAGPLEDVTCSGSGRPRGMIRAELREGVTRASADLFVGADRVLNAQATANTPLDQWMRDAAIDTIPAVNINALAQNAPVEHIPLACELMQGPVTAALEVEDLFGAEPVARLELHSPALRILDTQPVRTDAYLTVQDGSLDGSAQVSWWSGERADIEAHIPVDWAPLAVLPTVNEEEDMLFTGDFEAAPIGPFLAPLSQIEDVSGYMDGQVRVQGPIDDLDYQGEVEIYDGYLELVGLGQHLTDLTGTVDFRGNWAELRGFRAWDGDGLLRIDGGLGFEGYRPSRARLSLNADEFPVRREGVVLATLTGNASLSAEIGEDLSDMDLVVHRLDVRLPEEDLRSVQELERHPDVYVVGSDDDREMDDDPYVIHIDVDASEPFWVRRNDFAAQVTARLDVSYVDPDLLVRGEVVMRRGFFEVFGKRFVIERGTMHFDGGRDIDPEVILVASHELRSGPTVTVTVTGTLTTPDVEFRSTDANCDERSEVITMLLSGRCTTAVADEGQQQEAAQQAANVLAGITAGVLTLSLREELGDVLPVIAVESGDEGLQTARLRAGFDATEVVPEFLRGVVHGAYVEGVVAGASEAEREQSGQVIQPGVLIELQLPWDLVLTGEYEPPSAGRVDLTWEP